MVDTFVKSLATEPVDGKYRWHYDISDTKLAISYYSYKRFNILVDSLLSIPHLTLSIKPNVSVVLQSYTAEETIQICEILTALSQIEAIDRWTLDEYEQPLGFRNAYLIGFFRCLSNLDCDYILTMDDDTLFTDRSDLDLVMNRMNLIPWIGVTRLMHQGSIQDYWAKDKNQIQPSSINLPRGGPGMLYRSSTVLEVLNCHDLHDENGVCYDLHFSTISYLLGWKTYTEPVVAVLVNPKTPDMHFRPPSDWSVEGGFMGTYGSPEKFELKLKEFLESYLNLYKVTYDRNKSGIISFKTRYTHELIMAHRCSCVELVQELLTDDLLLRWKIVINSIRHCTMTGLLSYLSDWSKSTLIRPKTYESKLTSEFSMLSCSLGNLAYIGDGEVVDGFDFKIPSDSMKTKLLD